MAKEIWVTDKFGKRRKLQDGEILQDGDSMSVSVPMMLMDGKTVCTSLVDAAIKLAGSEAKLSAATSQLLDGSSNLTALGDTTIKLGAIMCWDAAHAGEHRKRPQAFIDAFFDSACLSAGIGSVASVAPAAPAAAHAVTPPAAAPVSDHGFNLADAKAKADQAYNDYCDRLSNAWKKGPEPELVRGAALADRYAGLSAFDRHRQEIADRSGGAGPYRGPVSLEDARARSETARAAYVERITNAWRKPQNAA